MSNSSDQENQPLLLANYIIAHLAGTIRDCSGESVSSALKRRVANDCADYILDRMPRAIEFQNVQSLWDYAIKQISFDGLIAEFGVYQGTSINHFASRLPQSTLFGFDSFEGLKEDWEGNVAHEKGTFSLNGEMPPVAGNVRLIKGWFDETLPAFLQQYPQPFSLLHVDCDTYQSTKTILDLAGSRIKPGTIIIFDEYFGYRGWRIGEFKAWQEFVEKNKIQYEYISFHSQQAVLRIGGGL